MYKNITKYYWKNINSGRYYIAQITSDMFGGFLLTLNWGSLFRKGGAMRNLHFHNEWDALIKLAEIGKKRERRGYNNV